MDAVSSQDSNLSMEGLTEELKGTTMTPENTIQKPADLDSIWMLNSATNDITKLFDRELQEKELLDAFHRRISSSSKGICRELVLINGPSGTGKTALACSLRTEVVANSGFFIAGKFDQLQRPEPYAPFCVAFTDLVRQIMEQDDCISDIRHQLVESVDSISMITDMIPAVNQLLYPDFSVDARAEVKSGSYGAQGRFLLVFCQFVRAICSLERPLVLFLDDLQWAEPASMELFAALAADSNIRGLMVLGACRGNEVAIEHHLAVTLRELESDRVAISNIEVGNVSKHACQVMLLEMFQLSEQSSLSLAGLVHDRTDGNIFFAIEFLKSLQKAGLFVCNGLKWSWEPNDDILSVLHYDNVVELISHKIRQLSPYEQEVIKIASCLGSEFDDDLIHRIVKSDEDVSVALGALETNGLIARQNSSSGYRFRHDRIQQAALYMIPEEQKPVFHLSIGRALLQALSCDDIHDNIFLIVNLLEVGVDLIENQEERTVMATLCQRAGERASVSSAFMVAFRYLNLGLCLLGDRRWRNHYGLTLDLTNAAAEVAYCNADYESVDALTASVLTGARCFDDKVRAYTTQIYSLGTRHAIQRAIDIGFHVLDELGEQFPKQRRLAYILLSVVKTNRMLRNKTVDDILGLPRLHDSNKLAAIRIMNLIFPYCMDGRLEFAPLLAMRVVQITIKYGISGMSCAGFGAYSFLLAGSFGEVNSGYRVGQLSLAILDRFKAKEWTARVYSACYGMCFTWRDPFRNSLKPLLVAHRVGLSTGDIEFSMLSASMYAGVALHAGCKLEKLLNEFTNFFEMMKKHKQYKMLAYIRAQLQLVHNFMGKARNPAVLNGEILDSTLASDEAQQAQNVTAIALLHLYNLTLAFYFNEYDFAREHALQLSRCSTGGFSSFTFSSNFLMEGLASLACRHPSYLQRRLAKRNLQKLKKYARLCPANMANKVYLLEGEIAASSGKIDLALSKYGRAIDQAARESIFHEKTLACERAGICLRDNGRVCSQAAVAYEDWGCKIKADQMRAEIESLSKSHPEAVPECLRD